MEPPAQEQELSRALPPNCYEAATLERLNQAEEALLELYPLARDMVTKLAVLPPDEAALSGETERFLEVMTRVRGILGEAIATVREPWPFEGHDMPPQKLRELAVTADREQTDNVESVPIDAKVARSNGGVSSRRPE
ncbi:hypothetical protein F1559_004215 [Cyanidiococcus yangmingshanensis]|uniref:Uncharacterized protein n=1 Tax=Cyanidiococcus yangmingshanensis TaxID=2690220 RepID=A0A7J7IL73_9RHOD|nr:hypothetical protein F1559_004215 [Cyanidiococcus yangmingshanensis]